MKYAFLISLLLVGVIFTQDSVTQNPPTDDSGFSCNTTLSQCYRALLGNPPAVGKLTINGNAQAVNNTLSSLWTALEWDMAYWILGNCTDKRTKDMLMAEDSTQNYTAEDNYGLCVLLAMDFNSDIDNYAPNDYLCNDGGVCTATAGSDGSQNPTCKCDAKFKGLFCFFSSSNYDAAITAMVNVKAWKKALYTAQNPIKENKEFSAVIDLLANSALLLSLGNTNEQSFVEAFYELIDAFANNAISVYNEENNAKIEAFLDLLASLPDGNSVDVDYSTCSPQSDEPKSSKSTGQQVQTPSPDKDDSLTAPKASGSGKSSSKRRSLQVKSTKSAPVYSSLTPTAVCPKSLNTAMTGCKYKLLYQIDPKALNSPGKVQVTSQVCVLSAYNSTNTKSSCNYPSTVPDSATLTCPWAFANSVVLPAGTKYSDNCKGYIYKNGTWNVAGNANVDTTSDANSCVLKIKEFGQYGCACTGKLTKSQVTAQKKASTSCLGITFIAIFLALLNLF